MIKLIINSHDFSDNVASFQTSTAEITGGNEFTTASGEQVKNITGYKLSLKIKLTQLSTDNVSEVINILNTRNIDTECDFLNFNGIYDMDGGYIINSTYNDRKKTEWEIDFTLYRNITDGGGL